MSSLNQILLIGAGEAGKLLLEEFRGRSLEGRITGFLDDDPEKIGTNVGGKPVLGPLSKAVEAVKAYSINEVILTIPSASSVKVSEVIESLRNLTEVKILLLPAAARYFEESLLSELSEITFADITGRQEVSLDIDAMKREVGGKVALVTGAGGSIGSEICRNLIRFGIKKLICLGRGENSIYELEKSLNSIKYGSHAEVIFRICDVRNYEHILDLVAMYKPDIIFHAAAHKHVPMMESNEAEACANNIGGTRNVLESAAKILCKVILVSTDKAVYPTSLMGTTKRVCELMALYYNKTRKLNVASVRFGNVLGSRGSVIQLFKEQILNGGPVTITDKRMKRYFMSIPEAALLVINASAYSSGGEIYMLEMGEQYLIEDIAKKMISIFSLSPVNINYTGLRKGEKLEEKLNYDFENVSETGNLKIKSVRMPDGYDFNKIKTFTDTHLIRVYSYSSEKIRSLLKDIVPYSEI